MPSFKTPHLCLKTIYSNECPLLGSGGALIQEEALIKKFSSKGGGALFRVGALIRKNTVLKIGYIQKIKSGLKDFRILLT